MPSKKWYKSIDDEFLERSRKALEEYLQVTEWCVCVLSCLYKRPLHLIQPLYGHQLGDEMFYKPDMMILLFTSDYWSPFVHCNLHCSEVAVTALKSFITIFLDMIRNGKIAGSYDS